MDTMKMEMLKAAQNVRKAEYEAAHEAVKVQVEAIVNSIAEESGVKGYSYRNTGWSDFKYLELYNETSRHSIDLHYSANFYEEDGEKVLTLNVSSMGSFGFKDEDRVAYYTLVGHIAANLHVYNLKLNAIEGWDKLNETRKNLRYVNDEIERMEREEAAAEKARKDAEITSRLIVGAEIITSCKQKRDADFNYVFAGGFNTAKVTKVTPKFVFIQYDCAFCEERVAKADAIARLHEGVTLRGNGWSFAGDVNEADFASAK